MKRAVSISLGSSKRDKAVTLNLLGEDVTLERIGTDGDFARAQKLFADLDGKTDALGVGGADLGALVADRWYPFHPVAQLVRDVKHTPIADGTGLKTTLERRVGAFIAKHIGVNPKRVLFTVSIDRWGMVLSFHELGYECLFGDFGFALDIPLRVTQLAHVKLFAATCMPLIGRLPF
jgi:hypothetical protein